MARSDELGLILVGLGYVVVLYVAARHAVRLTIDTTQYVPSLPFATVVVNAVGIALALVIAVAVIGSALRWVGVTEM